MDTSRPQASQSIGRADRIRIQGESFVDERTVAKCYRGERVTSATRARVEQAARRLGIAPPPAERSAERAK